MKINTINIAMEITVVKKTDDVELSSEERDILYQEISKKLNIPGDYFRILANLEDIGIRETTLAKVPEITSILFRGLFRYPCIVPLIKNYVKPISTEDVESGIFGSDESDIISQQIQRQRKHKASIEKLFHIDYSITDRQKIVYYPDLLESDNSSYIFSHQNSEICGIAILPNQPIKDYYVSRVIGNMHILGRVKSGNYSQEYLHMTLFVSVEDFLKNNLYKLLKSKNDILDSNGIKYVIFRNEEHARMICSLLYSLLYYFVTNINSYYNYRLTELLLSNKTFTKSSEFYKNLEVQLDSKIVNTVIEKPTKVSDVLDKIISKYLELFQPWVGLKITKHTIIYDMMAMGLLNEWMWIYYLSNDNKKYENMLQKSLENIKAKYRKNVSRQKEYQKLYDDAYSELCYRSIYIKKFGYHRYELLMPKEICTIDYIIYRSTRSILDVISDKERKIIILEKDRDEKYFQEFKNNDAPWIEISKKLRYAVTADDRKKYYHELKKYLPSQHGKNENDWIRSKQGFPIICPHVKEKIEMEIKGINDQQMHNMLLKYAGETPLYDAYYCNICGEPITYSDEMEGINISELNSSFRDIEEGMDEYIWKHVNHITRSNIEFKDMKTNRYMNQFVTIISKDLHGVITLIDRKIRKSKTNSLEEIDNKRKLYTYIYVWAILIKIVLENTGKIKFTFQKDFKRVSANILFDNVFNKILVSQNILLNSLGESDDISIKEALYAAYTNLSSILDKTKLLTPKPLNFEEIIILDPAYNYMRTIYELKYGPKHTVYDILGENLDNPRVSKLDGEDYYAKSYNEFIRYTNSKVYLVPIYDIHITDDSIGFSVTLNKEHERFLESLKPLRKLETSYIKEKTKGYSRPEKLLPFEKNRIFPPSIEGYPVSLLSRTYGKKINKNLDNSFLPNNAEAPKEKFHKHKWTILVYTDIKNYKGYGLKLYKSSVTKSYNIDSDINSLIAEKNYDRLILVDNICKICHAVITEPEDVGKYIEQEELLVNFFNYYQSRCPRPTKQQISEGDEYHKFGPKEICGNCGATRSTFIDRDLNYFKKYRDDFTKATKVSNFVFNNDLPEYKKIHTDTDLDKWKYNNNIVNEIVTGTLGITQYNKNTYFNIWNNLGLVENYDYDKVLSGEEKPDIQDIDSRIDRLDMYIKECIVDYYSIKNIKNISPPSNEIKHLAVNLGTKTGDLPDLPDNYMNFRDKVFIEFVEDKRKLSQYLLEYYIKTLLFIYSITNKTLGKSIANSIFLYILDKLVRTERISSKLKDQKAAAVEAEQKMDNNQANMLDYSQFSDDETKSSSVYEGMDYEGQNDTYNT
jgi:hypothetical protein